MKKALTIVLALLLIAGAAFGNGKGDTGGKMADEITIHWAQWAPADYLQKLSDLYTAETGVKVVVEQTPWETFVQKYNVEMIARSDAWDIIIGDSQDLGNMAANGHYVELTDWVKANNVDKDFTKASLNAYSEYPLGSGKYWGVPAEGDALGWAYRKDLFEDPDNMKAFQAKYGYKLDIPKDYNAMRDIAEFFHDPANGFYGISIYGDNGYDSLVMFAEQMIWSFGGELGNYATNKVDGYLNTPASADGLKMYKELFSFTPPAFNDAFFVKANDAFTAGIVPMTCNYFAFLPALANKATSPYADVTGYFPCPPQVGRDGVKRQFAALGGQGASVVTYSKKQDTAMSWMDWFIQKDVQLEWAKLGGYSCHAEVLESQEFLNAAPYNPAFAVTLNIMKDFWNVPPYGEMLESFSRTIGNYIIRGQGTAESALQAATKEWEAILAKL
jgi:multiple sugar transport system substrate-binding protein